MGRLLVVSFMLVISSGSAALILVIGALALGLIAYSLRIRQSLPVGRYAAYLLFAIVPLLAGSLVPDDGTATMWLSWILLVAAALNLLAEFLAVRRRSAEAAPSPESEE
ncbi:hypothetical protein PLCT2_02018 [Planctomycetaceae bacterium]|nr:hypothetical protein PLCT2_02018 [Planctomycetaceae bacterium]